MKRRVVTTVLIWAVFAVGLGVLAYPSISNYWNSLRQSHAIANYTYQAAQMSSADMQAQFDAADAYNQTLAANTDRFTLTSAQMSTYNSILDVDSSGMIGVLAIPKIGVRLPIYHGTSATVLQSGVGHLPGSSLPVGGPGTHAVLSGHRGLPSAELLTNIDQLVAGDQFQITILDQTLVYEVDQISTVAPEDLSQLSIVPGQDYVTLVTCTPYGVNTQRLLVRGHRVPTSSQLLSAESGQVVDTSSWTVVLVALAAITAVAIMLIKTFKGKRKSRQQCDAG